MKNRRIQTKFTKWLKIIYGFVYLATNAIETVNRNYMIISEGPLIL